MPKTRAQKSEIIDELADKLAHIKSAVFTKVSGYTMEDANSLREKGRAVGVEVIVAKKTLLVRALENNGFKIDRKDLEGSILTTFGFNDEVAAAKLIADFAKEREQMVIVGGILEGAFVGSSAIKQLATLPSKEQLLAQLVRTINGPLSGFVQVLAGNLRNFVSVLNAIKDTKGV
ncbi:MAG: 50S ribosomal protein L10 [Candidatus Uhrbacteria bacterium GW2011_GWF2_39_13]|uniref:Large ribosomal subunit protein uL10 n=1 Tax=Candidatus Uhrbacteria bacterium GW2011_GWF2_39_13 TaxID=1618995 RepID=A0A0G0MWM8_9BACT|nr:MAG: 50S ribosomal protein L10 [Candidatus Uhrbacteria bacterium GW2011_GWF2_39_13]HAU66266.1 50S ribosomal protein L10 [Candidatus Uhrbacteria bacterium]